METTFSRIKAAELVVVDAAIDDYLCLANLAKSQTIRLTTTSTGAGGLRLLPSHCDALWLVGLRLPDISGFELLEMIRSVQPHLTFYAIDSSYAAERERRALELSAARYLCKPVRMEWLQAWRVFDDKQVPAPQADARLDSQCHKLSTHSPVRNIHRKEKLI